MALSGQVMRSWDHVAEVTKQILLKSVVFVCV